MAVKKTTPLRAVGEGEVATPPRKPVTLTEAVASGDVLDMLLAQRRLLADAMSSASDSTRPQLNNELNKLHVLIAAEQERRKVALAEREASDERTHEGTAEEAFDSDAI